jgi:hypothetical protein
MTVENVRLSQSSYSFKKLPKAYEKLGFGILNAFGTFWTPKLFETPGEALEYIEAYIAKAHPQEPELIANYKVVRARCTTAAIAESEIASLIVYTRTPPVTT